MAKREVPEINAGSMADIAFLLLIFFLVTTTMDKDTAYIRSIPKKIEKTLDEPQEVQKRNICLVKANSRNQLMLRGELMTNPDDISDKVVEFYSMNRGLSKAETSVKIKDKSYEGTNFPFYSRISEAQINKNIEDATKAAEDAQSQPNASEDIVNFKWATVKEWEDKLSALKRYKAAGGGNELPEIDKQAHIRIEVQSKTEYELFAKIHSELEEAIYELRDTEAKELFGESYNAIVKRYESNESDSSKKELVKEDQAKLKLLEILIPAKFIEVAPKN